MNMANRLARWEEEKFEEMVHKVLNNNYFMYIPGN